VISSEIYFAIAGIIVIPAACVLLTVLLSAHMNPPEWKKHKAAHTEALTYLAGVIRAGAGRAPDRAVVTSQVDAVLELLQYPGRGNVGDWESGMTAMLYASDDEPSEPWHKVLAEYFEFARGNLYCAFVKEHNVAAYERVRACLAAVGVEAKAVEELTLGRL
jgi:hypothetical protein